MVKKLSKTEVDLKKALFESENSYNKLLKSRMVQESMSKQAAYASLLKNVSHELKNPMNMISLGIQSIISNLENKEKAKRGGELALKNVRRLKNVLLTMLKFGVEGSPERTVVSLNKIIESVILMGRVFLKEKKIQIEKKLSDIPDIHANEHQIHQIIMNIVVNACEAMVDGGILTFETNTAYFLRKDCSEHVKGVYVRVSDTGTGISPENLEKIFDPFFSTKQTNSGLGLSMTLKMIAAHGGVPQVESELGSGTQFTIYLPISQEPLHIEENGVRSTHFMH